MDNLPQHLVYSPPVIEFVTVVAETCLLVEQASEQTQEDFINKSVRLLSLLYFKTTVLNKPERIYDYYLQTFVSEEDYNYVKNQIEAVLSEKDAYLKTFHPDMSLSDTPIAAFISEDLADVYQELKDFAANYQLAETDIMNDALVSCIETFAEHWGQKLLNALGALHNIKYGNQDEMNAFEDDFPEYLDDRSVNTDGFLDFLRDE